MSTPVLIALLVGVMVVGLFAQRLARTGKRRRPKSDLDRKEEQLEDRFYKAVQNGEATCNLARIYSQMDIALLQSLLSSTGISTQILYGNTNNMRMGMAIPGYNDTIMVVLQKDFHRAREILVEYIENRKNDAPSVSKGTKVRNVAETLLAGAFANPNDQLPELIDSEDLGKDQVFEKHRKRKRD